MILSRGTSISLERHQLSDNPATSTAVQRGVLRFYQGDSAHGSCSFRAKSAPQVKWSTGMAQPGDFLDQAFFMRCLKQGIVGLLL